ncbi:hypothetical protein PoB_002428400 [Plakobranchus ocellatus]|uniref:Uncharacterized protein n=1 Tax=Plakobranchus ocellatus TaxID=259542 RepID=A0AAV3ZV50_9GAST|nr:hypothetical protein PoB_002428400 [Plakobranchus ocellatus]
MKYQAFEQPPYCATAVRVAADPGTAVTVTAEPVSAVTITAVPVAELLSIVFLLLLPSWDTGSSLSVRLLLTLHR